VRIFAGNLKLEVRPGAPASAVVDFARAHGVALPERPWCGPQRLQPDHTAGDSPFVAFARLTSQPGPDARPTPGVHLAVVAGPDAGAVATVREEMIIGRSRDAHLRLTDPAVSLAHARFAGGRVDDTGSTNGTRVGGSRVRRRTPIAAGAVMELGATAVMLVEPGAPGTDPSPQHSHRRGAGSWLVGGASAAGFAIMTGHWPFAAIALAVPAGALLASAMRQRKRVPPAPILDVTGTLRAAPLPPGPASVSGPRGLARAVTLAVGAPPRDSRQWEDWMAVLPSADREVVWLREGEEPPSWVQAQFDGGAGRLVLTAHGATTVGPLPLVTLGRADAAARRIASIDAGRSIPDQVTWGELPAPPAGGLRVRLGVSERGPLSLDLVADGPHLLVAGTTGSGKSEALRTIVASLAHDYSPTQVTFALIDFKGGAGLGPCAELPHVASVLTDLEPHLARRCLLALAAELDDRKRAAAAVGVRTYDEWSRPPPRLVIVVDEFQEMAAMDREFLPKLTRLAAQGRSLGIHLVLATQRPAGAVSADVRANISTTLALRTASESESRDLIGSPLAAQIAPGAPGRAMLARGAAPAELVQVALPIAEPPPLVRLASDMRCTGGSLADAARVRHPGRARALWVPALPEVLAPVADADRFVLGIADLPAQRRREAVAWDPAAGPLIVCGPPRSGRSSVLRSVAATAARMAARPVWVPADPRLAARTLALAAEASEVLLLLDDAERTLAAATTAEPEAMDLLVACMRRGRAALVVPTTWAHHRLVAGAGTTIVLSGTPSTDEASWEMPSELRGLPPLPGRARLTHAGGWAEAQLALPARWTAQPLMRQLPREVTVRLDPGAIGLGGDDAAPFFVPNAVAAIVGPTGEERERVARRVAMATGQEPLVLESALALGIPGTPSPRTLVVVRPDARSLREVSRARTHGLLEPSPLPFRCVVLVDGAAAAVQVLPG